MGKNLIQQRRGRLRGRYNVPSHKYRGNIQYGMIETQKVLLKDLFMIQVEALLLLR